MIFFFFFFFFFFFCTQFVLFNPMLGLNQVLPLLVRVNLRAMVMKGYSHSTNLQGWSLAIRYFNDTRCKGGGVRSQHHSRDTVSVFYSLGWVGWNKVQNLLKATDHNNGCLKKTWSYNGQDVGNIATKLRIIISVSHFPRYFCICNFFNLVLNDLRVRQCTDKPSCLHITRL